MNWKDEPATEDQLGHLRQFGYEPDHPLTKGEAVRIILDFEEHPELRGLPSGRDSTEQATSSAYRLHLAVEQTKRAAAEAQGSPTQSVGHPMGLAMARRQEFWADTCSDSDKMHLVAAQGLALHKRLGCRFMVPSAEQIQAILDSLDRNLPSWDRDHPELFYQTLELNFPELLRHRQHGQINQGRRI